MRYKKAQIEIGPITIIVTIVIIGLIIFFGIRHFKGNQPTLYNVTQINDTATSTAVQFVNRAGSINVTNGMDLTVNNPIANISLNNSNKNYTLIKVIYPNRTLTPGDIASSNITQICTTGYTTSVRNVSDSLKNQVIAEYKLNSDRPPGTFEVDHLVPLELGGSNNLANLWPQPASPKPGYHEKDVLENYYHQQVCNGNMNLQQAQNIMETNWFQGYVNAKVAGGIK